MESAYVYGLMCSVRVMSMERGIVQFIIDNW
jgi:hypothetical protein